MDPFAVFAQGALIMAGLIVAIGAQNALVLRQGLARRHVGPVVAFCAASDIVLTVAGVFGFGAWVSRWGWAMEALRYGGAAFLAWCGWQALRRVRAPAGGLQAAGASDGLAATLGTTAALTWLNPHVWLDTVVLVGTVGARQAPELRPAFAAGASLASVGWFAALGFGAAALAPRLARPATWRVIDTLVALVMFGVAAALLVTPLAPAG